MHHFFPQLICTDWRPITVDSLQAICSRQLLVTFGHFTTTHNFCWSGGAEIYTNDSWSTTTTTVLQPFFRDDPGEPVPEEKFWTLWCKGRLTEADTPTIRLSATPSRLSSDHLHHPPFFTGRMPFLPPNQQCQSTEGNQHIQIREKTLEFSSTVLPAPSPYPNDSWSYWTNARMTNLTNHR